MSRLRVPFRKQSTSIVESPVKEAPSEEFIDPPTVLVEKGKEKQVERLWGIENFGNTCYCNSVLQALYACEPFREFIASYPDVPAPISALAPAPSDQNKPTSSPNPTSPLANKTGNPFDNPQLNGVASPNDKRRGLFGRRPTSSQSALPVVISREPLTLTVPILTSPFDVPPATPNPNGPPPTVFETIQTLFNHLSYSLPHQPLPARKDAKADAENAQTASLLPTEASTSPQLSTPNGAPAPPPGPPLLASLPPPSAPRGGGPYQAGTLGRGVVRPEDLLKTVKRENEMFRGMSQQDAHEFLGWVLNKVAEDVEVVDRSLREVGKEVSKVRGHGKTFVQNLFEGILTNETRCLSCETTSSRDEQFLDLSIDIEQHSSVTACLRQFSASEMLCQKNKFFCDSCCGLQEAEKRMKIKRLPHVLALHLKRFKYQESLGRYTKLFYRVPFPTQLRLPNTSDETENPDRLYELFAVVVHIGNGPHHGHYVCLIRSGGRWVMCDDENIEPIDDADIFRYFGDYPSGAGYVLFYQAADLDLPSLGLATKVPAEPKEDKQVLRNISEASDEPQQVSGETPMSAEPKQVEATKVLSSEERSVSAQDSGSTVSRPLPPPVFHPSSQPIAFIQPRRNTTSSTFPTITTPIADAPASIAQAQGENGVAHSPVVIAPQSKIATDRMAVETIAQTVPPPLPESAFTPVATSLPSDANDTSTPVSSNAASTPTTIGNDRPQDDKWFKSKSIAKEPDLPSSVVSETSSQSSASHLGVMGRKPSQRDRNISSSSRTSAQDKYTGGGGLGRRLSGMSMGRSGSISFGKLGFGKKDKNKVEE